MQVLGIKNRTVNTGFTLQYDVFEKLEQARKQNYESRSHLVNRLLSAALTTQVPTKEHAT
jgi:metal-responsive CopG/Arc/MetJ family transcriptional regulator